MIYLTPPFEKRWEEKARQARHDHFSLETTCFPYVLNQDVWPRCFLQGTLIGTTLWPQSNSCAIPLQLSAQDSLPLFKQQTGTCRLEGFLVFFFSSPSTTEKANLCVTLYAEIGHKKGFIHHSSRPPMYAKASV